MSKEITEADFINLANKCVGEGLLRTGEANFELAKEYAKEKSIEFAEWKDNNYTQHPNGYYSKFNDGSHGKSHLLPKFHTLTELYNLFINQQQKP